MIDRKHLQEVERLNKLPISQEALKRLREAKAETYPERLYLLQLANWGLENGQSLQGVKQPMLESLIRMWQEWPPQKAYNRITQNEDNQPQIGVESLQGRPEQAAEVLLDQVGSRVLNSSKLNPIF